MKPRSSYWLAAAGLALFSLDRCLAIGPNAAGGRNPIAQPGEKADPYPFSPFVLIDKDGNGNFFDMADGICSGVMIAPRVLATAAHCVDTLAAPGQPIPAGRVMVRFGDPTGAVDIDRDTFNTAQSRYHPQFNPAAPFFKPHDVAYITLQDYIGDPNNHADHFKPVPFLPKIAQVNDEITRVGFGGPMMLHPVPKAWDRSRVDEVTADGQHYRFNLAAGETYLEPGDSGGPGFLTGTVGPPAYMPDWTAKAQNLFLAMVTHGGIGNGGQVGQPEMMTRLEQRGAANDNTAFLRGGMPLPSAAGNVQIRHNFSPAPCLLDPATPQGVSIKATYPVGAADWVWQVTLWEEDSQDPPVSPRYYDGPMDFGVHAGTDDLVGFGYGSGRFPGAGRVVRSYRTTTAGALCQLHEGEGAPADWTMQFGGFRYRLGPLALLGDPDETDVPGISDLDFANELTLAQQEIAQGLAVAAPIEVTPEPSSAMLLMLALAGMIGIRRRQGAAI